MKDEQLTIWAAKAIQGDPNAFEQLYTLKWKDVMYTALKIVGNEHDASDAVQETFISVYKNIVNLRDPNSFNTWLYQILMNQCRNFLKQRNAHKFEELDEQSPDVNTDRHPAESLDQSEYRHEVLKIVNTLPMEQRTVVVMFYYNQLSTKEISQITGMTDTAVRMRLHRARKSIEKHVENRKKKGVTLYSMAPLPLLTTILIEEAGRVITPQMYYMIKQSIITALNASLAGGAAASGTAAIDALAASTGGGKAAMTVASKILLGTLGASALAMGAVYANQMQEPSKPPSSIPAIHATTSSLVTSDPVVTSQILSSAPSSTAAETSEQPQSSDSPSSAEESLDISSGTSSEKPIETIADMIGDEDAQFLSEYNSRSDTQKRNALMMFFERHTMQNKQSYSILPELYQLFILEKQDKRLMIIERYNAETDESMVAYRLTLKSEEYGQPSALQNLFPEWQG